jgi:hypothetical protein
MAGYLCNLNNSRRVSYDVRMVKMTNHLMNYVTMIACAGITANSIVTSQVAEVAAAETQKAFETFKWNQTLVGGTAAVVFGIATFDLMVQSS